MKSLVVGILICLIFMHACKGRYSNIAQQELRACYATQRSLLAAVERSGWLGSEEAANQRDGYSTNIPKRTVERWHRDGFLAALPAHPEQYFTAKKGEEFAYEVAEGGKSSRCWNHGDPVDECRLADRDRELRFGWPHKTFFEHVYEDNAFDGALVLVAMVLGCAWTMYRGLKYETNSLGMFLTGSLACVFFLFWWALDRRSDTGPFWRAVSWYHLAKACTALVVGAIRVTDRATKPALIKVPRSLPRVAPVPRPVPRTDTARCAVCATGDGPVQWVSCPQCVAPHHLECWAYHGGCAIFGCAAAPSRPVAKEA